MEQKLIAEFSSLLESEAQTLERELATFAKRDPKMKGDWDAVPPEAPLSSPASSSSQEEQADISEEWESGIAQEHVLELRLAAVRRALDRIASSSYGRCLACGEFISEERLRANPAAEYDIDHQPKE